jgi:drug/metabolite transporter (DMT)-like permease
MPGWEVICWVVVIALPFSLTVTLIHAGDQFTSAPPHAVWAFVYLGLMSQLIGFFFWNAGLAIGGVAKVGQIQLLQTFVTIGFAALLLGETIDGFTIGFAVLVAAVVVIGRKTRVTGPPAASR